MNSEWKEIESIIKNLVSCEIKENSIHIEVELEITILKTAIISLMGMKLGWNNTDLRDKKLWQVNESISKLEKSKYCYKPKELSKLRRFVELSM